MRLEKREIEVISKQFVDRKVPLRSFEKIIKSKTKKKRVFCVHGETNIGKTLLLKKLMLECQNKDLHMIFLSCRIGSTFTNFLPIIRAIHKDLNQDFVRYQEAVIQGLTSLKQLNIQTGPGESGTGAIISGSVQGSINGVIAGRDVNNFYIVLGDERELQEPGVRSRITNEFLKDLIDYIKDNPIIFFFDEIGGLSKSTQEWLIKDFMRPLCRDSLSACFVLAKEEDLDQDLQQFIDDIAKKVVLKEFSGTNAQVFKIYREYLLKNGLKKNDVVKPLLKAMDGWVKRQPKKLYEFLCIVHEEED